MNETTSNHTTRRFTDRGFQTEVLDSEQPVLVDFYADWCGPCRLTAPTIDAVAEQLAGEAVVGKLDVDANPRTAEAYNIRSIPTVLVFRGGEVVARLVGVQSHDRTVDALREAL